MRKNGLATGFRYYDSGMCSLLIDDLGLNADEGLISSLQTAFKIIGKDPSVGEIYLGTEAFRLAGMTGRCTVKEVISHSDSVIGLWNDFISGGCFSSAPTLCEAAYRCTGSTASKSAICRSAFPIACGIDPAASFSASGYTLCDYTSPLPADSVKPGVCRTLFRPIGMSPSDFCAVTSKMVSSLKNSGITCALRPLTPKGFLYDLSGTVQGGSVFLKDLAGLTCPEDALHVLGSGAFALLPAGSEPFFDAACAEFGLEYSDIVRAISTQPIFGIIAQEDSVMTDSLTLDILNRGPEMTIRAEIPENSEVSEVQIESSVKSDLRAFRITGNLYEGLRSAVGGGKYAIAGTLSPCDTDSVPAIIALDQFIKDTGASPVCSYFTSGRKTEFTVFTPGKD